MIDYDKLKFAHELAEKLSNKFHLYIDHNQYGYEFRLTINGEPWDFINNESSVNLNDLIAKLQELTQQTPRYKVGDEVWSYTFGEMKPCKVNQIYWDDDLKDYRATLLSGNTTSSVGQSHIYPTRSQLIKAQIAYWISLRDKAETEKSYDDDVMKCLSCKRPLSLNGLCDNLNCFELECQHESDGSIYFSSPPQNKCKICGEFYT